MARGPGIQLVQPETSAPPTVPLSPGVRAGDLLFVSGQVATRADQSIELGDFETEVRLTLDNVTAVVQAAGGTLDQVVKVNAFLNNPSLFARFNAVYAEYFPELPPARTTIAVAFGHPDVRVEVEAVAHLGG